LSIGWLTTAWLTYIVSESDHRMVEVETWADKHIQTLSAMIPYLSLILLHKKEN